MKVDVNQMKNMSRYFVELAYNGAQFNGWQIQPNAKSIQQTLEEAFSLILREPISVTGCGRTDTGVHAKYYVAHFDCSFEEIDSDYYCNKFNSYLPKSIVLFKISKVDEKAHARFDALERSYEYHVSLRKDPFLCELSFYLYFNPDFDKMNEAAKLLLKYQDFTSFARLHSNVKSNECDVKQAEWKMLDETHWVFEITANRFLRNMVRAIVGTLFEVGKGNLDLANFEKVIRAKNRGKAGTSAPAQGLYLSKVTYPFPL